MSAYAALNVLISLHHIVLHDVVLCYFAPQEEQMYALAADCSIGSAGSAILMTHSKQASGEPALLYLKVSHTTLQHSSAGDSIRD